MLISLCASYGYILEVEAASKTSRSLEFPHSSFGLVAKVINFWVWYLLIKISCIVSRSSIQIPIRKTRGDIGQNIVCLLRPAEDGWLFEVRLGIDVNGLVGGAPWPGCVSKIDLPLDLVGDLADVGVHHLAVAQQTVV